MTKSECLGLLAQKIAICERCYLANTRTRSVPGEGNPDAEIVFVGEAPGQVEDQQGRPFVGAAGQLLTQVINRLGFYRRQVFIANILRCRPENNRKPVQAEIQECLPFLKEQLEIIQPKVIVVLGATALDALLQPEETISRMRGRLFSWNGFSVLPTWHPSYVLRCFTHEVRQQFWFDCLKAVEFLGYETTKEDRDWLPTRVIEH